MMELLSSLGHLAVIAIAVLTVGVVIYDYFVYDGGDWKKPY